MATAQLAAFMASYTACVAAQAATQTAATALDAALNPLADPSVAAMAAALAIQTAANAAIISTAISTGADPGEIASDPNGCYMLNRPSSPLETLNRRVLQFDAAVLAAALGQQALQEALASTSISSVSALFSPFRWNHSLTSS